MKFLIVVLVTLSFPHLLKAKQRCGQNNIEIQVFHDVEDYDCLGRVRKYKSMPNFTLDNSVSPDEERQVLVDLYNSTNGHEWCNNSGWLDSSIHHCSWYGITCHDNASYVKSIQLIFNNLNGFLPSSIWRLRNLLALCPNDNEMLRGQLQNFIFPNMSKLLSLSLRGTQLNGVIPEDMVKLSYLQVFIACALVGEKLSGHLPEDIGNMTELRFLCLSGGTFTGTIPRSISKLSNLCYLNIQNPPELNLTGNIEDLLSPSFKYLSTIVISGTSLGGTLPDTLPQALVSLNLAGNNVSGTLPSAFSNHSQLATLNLANNALTGDIPGELLVMRNLDVLDLSNNRFNSLNTGAPFDLINSSRLKRLTFSGNRNLTLNFQSFLYYLHKHASHLNELSLNSCNIEAKLTEELWLIDQLLFLDLGNNKIDGVFPVAMGDFLQMSHLDLSKNNVTGQIPSGIYASATNLNFLDITGNPFMSDEGRSHSYMNPSFVKPDFTNMIKIHWNANFTCPRGRFSFNNGRVLLDPSYYGYRFCVCDEGYYGLNGQCHKCMSGSTCQRRNEMHWSRELNQDTFMVMEKGMWPAEPDNVSKLVQCLSPKACNPSGSCECWLELTENITRDGSEAGHPVTKCNKTCLCSPGNTDRFCSRCLSDFYKSGGLCYQCSNDRTSLYVFLPILALSILVLLWAFFILESHRKISFVVIALEFILMLFLMILEYFPGWAFQVDLIVFVLCLTSRGKSLHTILSIAIFYFQTLDSMIETVHGWPEQVKLAQHYFSSIWNFQFSALSCDFPHLFTPVGKLTFIFILPLLCIALTWLYYTCSVIYNRFRGNEGRIRRLNCTCRKISILILNVAYFPVVESTVSVLTPCVGTGSTAYLRSMPWVECSSGTYNVLHSLSVCSLVVFVLGIPFFIFLPLLLVHRKTILSHEESRDADLDSWLGSIYLSYKAPYRSYFEIVVLLRRLFLAFSLSFIDSSSASQTLAVCSILTAAVVVQLLLKPYKSANERFPCENILETLVLVVLTKSFMISRFVIFQSPESGFFMWLFICINSAVVAGLVVAVLVSLCWGKLHLSPIPRYIGLPDLASQ